MGLDGKGLNLKSAMRAQIGDLLTCARFDLGG
jgi:hypothetical protein